MHTNTSPNNTIANDPPMLTITTVITSKMIIVNARIVNSIIFYTPSFHNIRCNIREKKKIESKFP